MKVKTLIEFKDLKDKTTRKVNEEFIVNKDRFEEINSTKYGKLVEEIKEEK